MKTSRDICVILEAEGKKISRYSTALLQEGERLSRELGGQLHALFVGPNIEDIAQEVGRHGVGKLFMHIDDSLRQYDPDPYKQTLLLLLREIQPYLLLGLASSCGSDLMPRLAFKLGVPLVTRCADIIVEANKEPRFIKPVQNNRLHATIRCLGDGMKMATFLPDKLLSSEAPEEKRAAAEIIKVGAPERETAPIKVIGFRKADHRTIDISEAEIIVAVGRGMGSMENFKKIQTFADRVGGAIGGTRPMVDSSVLPYERQIGQTGKRVSPKLIFLCGISGAMEFTKGIEGAGTRVAINIDRQSPIFKSVDLGIVGDLNELTPKISDHIGDQRPSN